MSQYLTEKRGKASQARVSKKISHLVKKEGVPHKQSIAMALSMEREGRLKADGSYIPVKEACEHCGTPEGHGHNLFYHPGSPGYGQRPQRESADDLIQARLAEVTASHRFGGEVTYRGHSTQPAKNGQSGAGTSGMSDSKPGHDTTPMRRVKRAGWIPQARRQARTGNPPSNVRGAYRDAKSTAYTGYDAKPTGGNKLS